MRSFWAALRFLTILPLPNLPGGGTERVLGRSAVWFPVVGLLIGCFVAGIDFLLLWIFPPLMTSFLVVLLLTAVSGGLHADGLADMADGFLSARPRERILEILRDSRIGTMGVLGLLGVFGLKFCALASLPEAWRLPLLIFAPLAGRCSLVLQLSVLNYARTGGGLCAVFVACRRRSDAMIALAFLFGAGWLLGGLFGIWWAVATLGVLLAFCVWCYRKIGGFTGDTLGAGCEVSEAVPLLLATAGGLMP